MSVARAVPDRQKQQKLTGCPDMQFLAFLHCFSSSLILLVTVRTFVTAFKINRLSGPFVTNPVTMSQEFRGEFSKSGRKTGFNSIDAVTSVTTTKNTLVTKIEA